MLMIRQGLRRLTSLVQHELEKKVLLLLLAPLAISAACHTPTHPSHTGHTLTRLLQVVETQDVTGSSWSGAASPPRVSSSEATLVSV